MSCSRSPRPAEGRRAAAQVLAVVLAVLLLTGCSDGGGASADPTPTPSTSPAPTPSATPTRTPGEVFAREVEELYALVKPSVEGSPDLASSAQVLEAFATTVALVRVPPELRPTRQTVVDAAEAAAQSYGTAAGITGAVERAAATKQAVVRLRQLEKAIRTLPE